MTEDEYCKYEEDVASGLIVETSYSYRDILVEFWGDLKQNVNNAYNSLRAIFELAKLIDTIDENAYAEIRLFGSDLGCGCSEQVLKIRTMLRASEKPKILRKQRKKRAKNIEV